MGQMMQSVQPLDVSTACQELWLQNGNLQGGYAHNGNDEMKVKEKKQSVWCVCMACIPLV